MCLQFTCAGCSLTFTNHCKDRPAETKATADSAIAFSENSSDDTSTLESSIKSDATTVVETEESPPCLGPTFTTSIKRCETCVRVKGAITVLNNLVFQAPFLVIDGLSGLEKLADWEKEGGIEELLCGRKKSWDHKAESREERRECQERIKKMGLDDVVDERKSHQGFDMSVTPKKEVEKVAEIVW